MMINFNLTLLALAFSAASVLSVRFGSSQEVDNA